MSVWFGFEKPKTQIFNGFCTPLEVRDRKIITPVDAAACDWKHVFHSCSTDHIPNR